MKREEQLTRLRNQNNFDIIIIGGGATGLGCAVDAATRGLKTLLVEKYDFAKGTSSKATKLVHGGVRYLAQKNIRLVKEALLERGRLLKNAPHVCKSLAFVVPCYSVWQKMYYGFGLWLYEWLSGKLSLGKTKWLNKQQVLQYLPHLQQQKLKGGILYFDAQFDDARLAVNLAATAVKHNAIVVNYCTVYKFIKQNNTICGVCLKEEISGELFTKNAKLVINATGVFADEVLQMVNENKLKTIVPSQGIHLVINNSFLKNEVALMIPKTDDGRVLFAIPWNEKLLIGTTDTLVDNIDVEPKPLQKEIDFLIEHFNRYSHQPLQRKNVTAVFTGLRPLALSKEKKQTSLMPRDHVIHVIQNGLIHVTGGKWTTYRSMAEHAINKAIAIAALPHKKVVSKKINIHGYSTQKINSHLSRYGCFAKGIEQMLGDNKSLAEKIHPNYPYTKAEVLWIIENEMAITIEDILARRIRLLFLDAEAAWHAAPVIKQILAEKLNYNETILEKQMNDFEQLIKIYSLQKK